VPDINHCFEIPTKYLIATGPRKPITRDEGPDIVLLKIPDAKLGEIKARCSFYSLKPVVPKLALKTPCIEIGILLGAPGEAAKSTANSNLDVTIQGVNADPAPKIFTKGPYDYLDSKEIAGNFGFPKSYRGFSGGGLWRLHVYYDPDTRERKFRARLDGMAFHESSLKGGHRFIRCHGRRSIDAVKRMVLTKKTEQHD
ncbi:MAG: hypothetical protein ACRD52_09285, partial [Candidatus Acidiferrales bacterium]